MSCATPGQDGTSNCSVQSVAPALVHADHHPTIYWVREPHFKTTHPLVLTHGRHHPRAIPPIEPQEGHRLVLVTARNHAVRARCVPMKMAAPGHRRQPLSVCHPPPNLVTTTTRALPWGVKLKHTYQTAFAVYRKVSSMLSRPLFLAWCLGGRTNAICSQNKVVRVSSLPICRVSMSKLIYVLDATE